MDETRQGGESMRAFLSFILLSVPFTPATLGQQPTQADKSLTPAAARTAYELKIEFNSRVPMRDRTELSADIYRPNATGRFPSSSRAPLTPRPAPAL
jgi:predicted acyl esterase